MPPEIEAAPTDDATGHESANGGTAAVQQQERVYSKAEVEVLVQERLKRQKAQFDANAEQVRKDVEAAQLAEQGKWKELAEAHAAKVAELAPTAERVRRLEAVLEKQLTAAMEGVPDHIRPLLEKLDPAERLEYLAEHRSALIPAAQGTPSAGVGTPRPGKPAQAAGITVPSPRITI